MAVLQNTVEHLTKSAPPLQSYTHNSPTNTMRTDCKDTKFSSTFQNDYNDVFLMDRNKLLELVRFRFRKKKEELEDVEKDSEVEENPDDDSNEAEEIQNPDDDDKENEHEAEENNKEEKKDLEIENFNKKCAVFSIQYLLQWCKPFSRN